MEEKLAQFLSRMEGAGRVEVLITYASTEEQVIEKGDAVCHEFADE